MKSPGTRTFLIAALSLSAALVIAQGATGGQGGAAGPGRQGGQGRQNRLGGQARGMGGVNELQLALRSDVQADIKVTDEQKKKLEELSAKQREARQGRPGGQGGAGAGGGAGTGGGAGAARGGQGRNIDSAEFQKRMQEQREANRKALAEILNEGQIKRIGEISMQLRGSSALMDPEVQKGLGFTAEQTAKIAELQQKQMEANRSIQEKQRNQEISREEAQSARQKNQTILTEELGKVLTPEQAAKFKTMQGAPFKADPNIGRGGGGG